MLHYTAMYTFPKRVGHTHEKHQNKSTTCLRSMTLQLLPCTIHPHIVSVRDAHPRMYGGRYVLDCYVKDKFMTCTPTWTCNASEIRFFTYCYTRIFMYYVFKRCYVITRNRNPCTQYVRLTYSIGVMQMLHLCVSQVRGININTRYLRLPDNTFPWINIFSLITTSTKKHRHPVYKSAIFSDGIVLALICVSLTRLLIMSSTPRNLIHIFPKNLGK